MNRGIKSVGALALIGLGLIVVVTALQGPAQSTSAAEGATVSLLPASQNVDVGDIVTMEVAIDNVTGLGSYEFRIRYNTKVLKLEDYADGGFLGSTGRRVLCPPPSAAKDQTKDTRRPDEVWLGCYTPMTQGSAPEGSGLLARVSFSAIKPGLSYLTFTKLELGDDMSDDIAFNRSEAAIRVIGPDEPTPTGLPATPTPDPIALTPTPIADAPTPSTWLTPQPGETPMTMSLENARAAGAAKRTGNSASQGRTGDSPRAGEGPSQSDPAWWPPLLAGLLAAGGASLLPLSLYLRRTSVQRRI